jgi:hypothetical protein
MSWLTHVALFPDLYSCRSSGEEAMYMYKIQLTTGAGWDAPVHEEHIVNHGIHIAYVERTAQTLLNEARRNTRRVGPTNYRIIDAFGRFVRSSTTRATPRTYTRRAGRTVWPSAGSLP